MDDKPLQVGITGEKEKERGLVLDQDTSGRVGFLVLVCWVGFTGDGSEGKIIQCCLEGSGGRHELLGGGRTGQAGTSSFSGQDFAAAKTSGCKVAGGSTSLLAEGCLLTDRVIFEPMLDYLGTYLRCLPLPLPYLACDIHSFSFPVIRLHFMHALVSGIHGCCVFCSLISKQPEE